MKQQDKNAGPMVSARVKLLLDEHAARGGTLRDLALLMLPHLPGPPKPDSVVSDLGRYRDRKTSPGADKIVGICRAFQVSADWLLGLTDVRRPATVGWDRDLMRQAIRDLMEEIVAGAPEARVGELRPRLIAGGALEHYDELLIARDEGLEIDPERVVSLARRIRDAGA